MTVVARGVGIGFLVLTALTGCSGGGGNFTDREACIVVAEALCTRLAECEPLISEEGCSDEVTGPDVLDCASMPNEAELSQTEMTEIDACVTAAEAWSCEEATSDAGDIPPECRGVL